MRESGSRPDPQTSNGAQGDRIRRRRGDVTVECTLNFDNGPQGLVPRIPDTRPIRMQPYQQPSDFVSLDALPTPVFDEPDCKHPAGVFVPVVNPKRCEGKAACAS